MGDRCAKLSTRAILGYSMIHVVFNQEHILVELIRRKAFIFKPPWVDWKRVELVVGAAKKKNLVVRSSNYYSTTLKKPRVSDPVKRDVLGARLSGFDSLPLACCDMYDTEPSRPLWKAMLEEWRHQVQSKCKGVFSDYYMKCALDRLRISVMAIFRKSA